MLAQKKSASTEAAFQVDGLPEKVGEFVAAVQAAQLGESVDH